MTIASSSPRLRYSERMLSHGDTQLVQIVDAAVADAARRSGSWLLCAPGCTQCCIGVFPISQLDAARLREGLASLSASDPQRAAAVRRRSEDSVARLSPEFPGNPETGVLDESRADLLEDFANDEPCPALDPATGLCDLYAARPMTCRLFGPPLQVDGGLGVCELCFHGAAPDQIAACEVRLDSQNLEESLTAEAERVTGRSGDTMVAWALRSGQ
ncbi:MAG TPA: YkgJ family cysteine cluster protein [Acidobacteriaceae bacterium]|jgi:Fe-S-cluster containining protein|nr:YkgJ family cysteine cluster protein [Acidobacteriaceae bacterium]